MKESKGLDCKYWIGQFPASSHEQSILRVPHDCHDLDWLWQWGAHPLDVLSKPEPGVLEDLEYHYVWLDDGDLLRKDGKPWAMTFEEAEKQADKHGGIVLVW